MNVTEAVKKAIAMMEKEEGSFAEKIPYEIIRKADLEH